MKHFLLCSVIVKLKLDYNTLMIILYLESVLIYYANIHQWYSEIETALYDHYRARGKGKSNIWSVWFDLKNNKCLLWKCVHAHTEKISSWLTLTSAVPVSICCRLISKREQVGCEFSHHFQIDFFWMNTKNMDKEFERHSSFDLWHN